MSQRQSRSNLKPITLRSANVVCSKCNRKVEPGEQYVQIGGFKDGEAYKIKRCVSCGFTEEELHSESPFRSSMIRLEDSIDEAVDNLETGGDVEAFATALRVIAKELHEIAAHNQEIYDRDSTQKLHRRTLSRALQTREIGDWLLQIIDNLTDGRFTVAQAIERAPSDLRGIA